MLQKLKELTKDTAIYGISTIIGRFLGFILVPFYTNVFRTEDFGVYSYIYAYVAFLNIVYIYGMDSAFMKYESVAAETEKKSVFSTPYLFSVATSVFISLAFYVFRDQVCLLMQIPVNYSYLIYYVIAVLFFDTVTLIPFANLRLQRKAKKFALIKILNIGLNVVLNLVLILKYKMGIEAVFISNLASSVLAFLILIPDIARNLRLSIDRNIILKMLKFGVPYLPASMAAMIVQVIDRPVLNLLTNPSTVGIYQANYKLGIFMMLFVSMFQYAWQPFFLNNAKDPEAKQIFSKVMTLFITVASVLWLLVSLFIEDFAKIPVYHGKTIIGTEFLGGLKIVPIILLAYIFDGIYINLTAGLYIKEKTKYFPYITGLGALVNVVVNFALIPVWGMMGAAVATLMAYFAMACMSYWFNQKIYKMNFETGKIFSLFSLILVTMSIFYGLYYSGHLHLLVKFCLLVFFVGGMFVFKVIKKEELRLSVQVLMRKK